jgi:hypothetical protein
MLGIMAQTFGMILPYWSVKDSSIDLQGGKNDVDLKGEASLGLWKGCGSLSAKVDGKSGELDACIHVPVDGVKRFPKNSLHICRSLVILSYAFLIASVFVVLNSPLNLKKICVPLLIMSGILGVIANIVWASDFMHVSLDDKLPKLRMKPGSAFYLNLLGSVCPLIATIYVYYS